MFTLCLQKHLIWRALYIFDRYASNAPPAQLPLALAPLTHALQKIVLQQWALKEASIFQCSVAILAAKFLMIGCRNGPEAQNDA